MRLACRGLCLLVLTLSAGCGKGLTTETGPCTNVAGAYKLAYGDACARFGHDIDVRLAQSGCRFTGALPGIGAVDGTLVNQAAEISIVLDGACKGTLHGTAHVEGTRLEGTYAGGQ